MDTVVIVGSRETGWDFTPDYLNSHQTQMNTIQNLVAPHPEWMRLHYLDMLADQGIDPSDMGGPGQSFPTTEKKTVHLSSQQNVAVTFDPNADHAVTQSMQTAFNEIVGSVKDLSSLNISATTNGHVVGSNHEIGDAVDINWMNGIHISNSGKGLEMAKSLEAAAMMNPNIRFVEGPIGNFVRTEPGGKWFPSPFLGKSNFTHVHFDVFPKK